jgi:predicted metal-dependent hydrolase
MKSGTAEAIERGRTLFNERRFFEAHEAWEEAWLREEGELRLLLQGLIQIAAALHKIARGDQPSGCARLLSWGLAKIEARVDALKELDLRRFRSRVRAFADLAELWQSGGSAAPAPSRFPRIARKRPPLRRRPRARKGGRRRTSPS